MNLYDIAKDVLRNCVKLLAKSNSVDFQWIHGYYSVGNSIFSKITAAEIEGKQEFPFTMGQSQYDLLDYYDFGFQVVAVVGQSEINGIINVGSGKLES